VQVVSISIERGLLKRSDRLAKSLKVSRAKLVAAGLERVLAEAGGRASRRKSATSATGVKRVRRKAA
jgi:metal-responsive CopG/Arc/MetJ family transcriptional regulator